MKMLITISDKVNLHVFVDLSLYTAAEENSIGQLLDLVGSLKYSQMVVSASSGIRHLSSYNRILNEKLGTL